MSEFNELVVTQQAGEITTNLDTIEAEIKEKMAEYKDYVVSEDSIKSDKKVLAELRKTKTELDNARKEVKNAWMMPYEAFEKRCKEVIALVDEPIDLINSQLKLFEEERIEKKKLYIESLYKDNIQGLERFLPFEKVINANSKWLNASTKDQDVLFDLNGMVLKVKNDLNAIKALHSEIEDEIINIYEKSSNDLSSAIQRNSQYLADKEKVKEQIQAKVTINSNSNLGLTMNLTPPEQLMNEITSKQEVHFIVNKEDADSVREMLEFANINFREE